MKFFDDLAASNSIRAYLRHAARRRFRSGRFKIENDEPRFCESARVVVIPRDLHQISVQQQPGVAGYEVRNKQAGQCRFGLSDVHYVINNGDRGGAAADRAEEIESRVDQ